MLFSLFVAIDPSLGRLDYESLTDQARMEILVANLPANRLSQFQDAHGNFKDLFHWGVCIGSDPYGNVYHILFAGLPENALNLRYIPPHVKSFALQKSGECDLKPSDLPQGITNLCMTGTPVRGDFAFSALPKHMIKVFLNACELQGTADMQHLPQDLNVLRIDNNQLRGSLLLDKLPKNLAELWAHENCFSGALILDDLPASMSIVSVHSNEFRELRIAKVLLPSRRLEINARWNAISGTAVIAKGINARKVKIDLLLNTIEAVVDENGKRHRFEKSILPQQKV